MRTFSSFMAGHGRPARTPTIDRDQSGFGVTVTIDGWQPGFNKVRFTQMVRDAGYSLGEAFDVTEDVLNGKPVSVTFSRRADTKDLLAELRRIGAVIR